MNEYFEDYMHSPSSVLVKINEKRTSNGHFILVANKNTSEFYIHARIDPSFYSINETRNIILALGFQQSMKPCDFHAGGSDCFWVKFFEKKYETERLGFDEEVQYVHQIFTNFADKFNEIVSHAKALKNLIPTDYVRLPLTTYSFELDPKLLQKSSEEPLWVEKYAPKVQIELRDEILQKIGKLKEDYITYQKLLYSTGKDLEVIVALFFQFIGMTVTMTEPAFPVDLLAKKGQYLFAIEVTGITGNINNKDRKVGQAITYVGEKKDDEKVILIANTYRDKDINSRPVESYTKEAEKILKPFDICMTTGVDIYTMWKDIIEGKLSKEDAIKLLKDTIGVLKRSTA